MPAVVPTKNPHAALLTEVIHTYAKLYWEEKQTQARLAADFAPEVLVMGTYIDGYLRGYAAGSVARSKA